MKKIILFFFSLLLIISISNVTASSHKIIRLAIFDNPQPDPSSKKNTQQFISSYLSGINTAITVAASKGIEITEKEFFHENNLANIIQKASETKEWRPDVIIGLSTSNDFLMSKAFFSDQVILSISATDAALTNLPSGFYSLGIPDTEAVNIIIKFINQHYKNPNLFITAAAESKESVDFADLLAEEYKKKFKNQKVIRRKFLTDDMSLLNFSKFMSGYQKGDIIIVMSIGYDSAIDLMNKITEYLKPIKPIFITSIDNWGNTYTPQTISGSYDAYRIDTLSGGEDTQNYKIFLENYIKLYHRPPKDRISFVTYRAVISFVEALLQYPSSRSRTTKQDLLSSYLSALNHDHNWFRPPYYNVYKLENQKEFHLEKIS
jgi:hypothetical protein